MKPDIREMPIDELRVLKVYRDLVPRPWPKDLELLRAEIKSHGLDPSRPLVVNEDLVVLDGHSRLEIAKDLGLEWAWVTIKELEDNWAEREFVIKANLARRQLNTAQRAELGLKLLEIERERAKRRQQLAGQMYGRGQESPGQEEFLQKWVRSLQEQAIRESTEREKVSAIFRGPITSSQLQQEGMEGEKLDSNSEQAIMNSQCQAGKAADIVAQQVGVSSRTIEYAQAIQQAAAKDPEVAAAWEEARAGKGTVNRVYRRVRIKDLPKHYGDGIGPGPFSLEVEEPELGPSPRVYSEAEKWQLLWMVGDHYGVPRESLRHVMTTDSTAWFYWHQIVHDGMIESIGWSFIMDRVERYEKAQIARLVSERPLPADAEALGAWALDHAHVGGMAELLRTFPEERVHLVFTDARRAGPEEFGELAAFGQRVLVPGKWLCAYVPQGLLPVILQTMAGHGLEYRWTCAVARPNQRDCQPKYTDLAVLNKWWMLLIFQKPAPDGRQFGKLVDSEHGEVFPLSQPCPDGSRQDAVVSNQVFVKDLPRQIVECLTLPGQLLVDPYVWDGGVLGMVAQDTGRRYLLFHGDREQAMAAEFHVKQDGQWEHQAQTRH